MDTPYADIQIGKITSKWAEGNNLYTIYLPETESTNSLAKQEAFSEDLLAESIAVYLTDHQTNGRGRGTHTWTDAHRGSSLLSSWSFLLNTKPQPTTSCLMGLALYRACSSTWPFLAWSLKAPNDIYLGTKKVAGLLLETVLQGDEARLIVGLGINITQAPASEGQATSLVESLPPGVPLLGQDYMSFLDRLLFEITDAVSRCHETLTTTDQWALLTALNHFPLLKEKYSKVEANGSLLVNSKRIDWTSL